MFRVAGSVLRGMGESSSWETGVGGTFRWNSIFELNLQICLLEKIFKRLFLPFSREIEKTAHEVELHMLFVNRKEGGEEKELTVKEGNWTIMKRRRKVR